MSCKASVELTTLEAPENRNAEIRCEIRHSFNQLATRESGTIGHCWHDLFLGTSIARGYAIPKKPQGIVGVELSLSSMAALTGAHHISDFGGVVFLKGFSSMLVLMSIHGDACQWHYFFNENGSRIKYADSRVRKANPLKIEDVSSTYETWIGSMRHGIGWCQNLDWLIGKRRLCFFFHLHLGQKFVPFLRLDL